MLLHYGRISVAERMEDHWVQRCRHIGSLLAERVLEAYEEQTCGASLVAGSYFET